MCFRALFRMFTSSGRTRLSAPRHASLFQNNHLSFHRVTNARNHWHVSLGLAVWLACRKMIQWNHACSVDSMSSPGKWGPLRVWSSATHFWDLTSSSLHLRPLHSLVGYALAAQPDGSQLVAVWKISCLPANHLEASAASSPSLGVA